MCSLDTAQITWAQNDIKMASELQSLACATCAVAADMIFSLFDVGVDFITVPSKQELFYIYLVNLLVIILAQTIAQYEIKSKVSYFISCVQSVGYELLYSLVIQQLCCHDYYSEDVTFCSPFSCCFDIARSRR
jgi:hypothetical protein